MQRAGVTCVDLVDALFHPRGVILIIADRRARRRGDLDEREAARPFRLPLEEARDGVEALDDALGVIESLDTHTDLVTARQVEAHANTLARLVDGHRARERRRRPLDRDRIAMHRRTPAAADDRGRFAIDAG